MAQPTIKQQRLLAEVGKHITWIGETNDIDSPSHNNLTEDFIRIELNEFLPDLKLTIAEEIMLESAISEILRIVRRHK